MSVNAFQPFFVASSTGSAELNAFGFSSDQPLVESDWLPAGNTLNLSADDGSFVGWSASGTSGTSRILLASQFRSAGQKISDLYAANAVISSVQVRLAGLLRAKDVNDTQVNFQAGIGVDGGTKTLPYDPPGLPPPQPAYTLAPAVITSGVNDVPFDVTINAGSDALAALTAANFLALLRNPNCYLAIVVTNNFNVPLDLYFDVIEIVVTQTASTSNLTLQPINQRDRNTRPLWFARSAR